MRGSNVEVIELASPHVQTELLGEYQATDPRAMPLKDYIDETMGILQNTPEVKEVLVERVKSRRFAEANGTYDQTYEEYNALMSKG